MDRPRTPAAGDSHSGSYLGPEYAPEPIARHLDTVGAKYTRYADERLLCEAIAALIEAGKVVGHFAGRMEFGPRALGHRSILGDARNPEMQRRMIVKINPLAGWTKEEVWWYIVSHDLPYNPLHDKNYASIGCWPCTQPVLEGEDERSGRWKGFEKKECGIHTFMSGI